MLKGLFLDLSGVLYEGSRVLPGALEAVRRITDHGLTLRFVTNTSRRSRGRLLEDLHGMGFSLTPEQLFTAPLAAAGWVREQKLRPLLLVHPDILCDFAGLESTDPNVVVLGDAAEDLNYANLDRAFRLLIDGAPLLALGDNRYFKDEDGLHLDAGPFVRALEYAADTSARVTGKPARTFFEQVLADTGLNAGEVMMFGDDIHGDIEGALAAGLQACLIRAGKYRQGDEQRIHGQFEVADSLLAWVDARLR